MKVIEGKNISYKGKGESLLDNISFSADEGEFIAILGNGDSGKDIIPPLIDGLFPLREGSLLIKGLDVKEKDNIKKIRKSCGLIFKNPDDQFICPYLDENLAFPLKNFGFPESDLGEKIAAALKFTGLEDYERKSPQLLTREKKLRCALAMGIVYEPDILILDEFENNLDRYEIQSFFPLLKDLNARGKTIILLTNKAHIAAMAKRVILMHKGKILGDDTEVNVLSRRDLLEKASMEMPFALKVYNDLLNDGVKLPAPPLNIKELVNEICR